MQCNLHPDRRAVATCAVCARPICKECMVATEGKKLCHHDAEVLLVREERARSLRRRGASLTVSAIFTSIEGISGIVVGFLLIVIGLIGSANNSPIVQSTIQPFLNYFSTVLQFPPWQTLSVGFVLLTFGTADAIAGYYIWRRSRKAALASIAITCVTTPLLATYLVVLALVGPFLYVHFATVAVKLVTLAYGWKHLRVPHGPAPVAESTAKSAHKEKAKVPSIASGSRTEKTGSTTE